MPIHTPLITMEHIYCGKQYPDGPPRPWTPELERNDHVIQTGAYNSRWDPEPPKHPVATRLENGVEHVFIDGVVEADRVLTEPHDSRGGRGTTVTFRFADGTTHTARATCRICGGEIRKCLVTA